MTEPTKKIMVGAVGVPNTHTADALYSTLSWYEHGIQLNLVVCILQAEVKEEEKGGGQQRKHRHEKLLFVLLKEIKFHLDTNIHT